MAGCQNPIGVAEWKNQIAKALPEELRSSQPSIEEIEKKLGYYAIAYSTIRIRLCRTVPIRIRCLSLDSSSVLLLGVKTVIKTFFSLSSVAMPFQNTKIYAILLPIQSKRFILGYKKFRITIKVPELINFTQRLHFFIPWCKLC